MDYFPLGFQLSTGKCLLVGGGESALAKARLLEKAGANMDALAAEFEPELVDIVKRSGGKCHRRAYRSEDCKAKILIVVAEHDDKLARQVSKDAQALNIPVNVVDQPKHSTVIFPAIVERDPLYFAVYSDGKLPILSRYWRHRLESYIEPHWRALASFLEGVRTQVSQRYTESKERLNFWDKVFDSKLMSLVFAGKTKQAQTVFKELLNEEDTAARGEVWLVGAGPGNPDLLTVAAVRLMQRADVVFYDRLISKEVLERVRRDARKVLVGKSAGEHSIAQDDINQLLIDEARAGNRVLRLKGGDPFIFARGGEEIDSLANAGIPFTVIPGISAASGAACYAGIPLTDRRYAHSVRYLSGHTRDGKLNLPWQELLDPGQTLVFYMSNQRLEALVEGLLGAGMDAKTPAAMVENATRVEQRTVSASLDNLVSSVKSAKLSTPTVLIVGKVVSLHDRLNWYGGNNE